MKKRFSYIWLGSLFLIGWVSDGGAPIGAVALLVLLWFAAGLICFAVYSREQVNKRQHEFNERMKGVRR